MDIATIIGLILDLLVSLSIIKTTLKKVAIENAKVATFGVVKLNHA